jgi:uncharacterized peroxidase-related enzyme
MWEVIRQHILKRWDALVSAGVGGLLGLECRPEDLRGELDPAVARVVATDRITAPLSSQERAILRFTEHVTADSSSIGQSDLQALREVGLDDRRILAVAALIAYQNYSIRAAQALGVRWR